MCRAVGEIGAIFGAVCRGRKVRTTRKVTHFSTKQKTAKTLAISEENGLATTAILVRKVATCGGKIGRDCPSYFLAGISAGVAKPPLRLSQRTATPTAQGLLPFCTKGLQIARFYAQGVTVTESVSVAWLYSGVKPENAAERRNYANFKSKSKERMRVSYFSA